MSNETLLSKAMIPATSRHSLPGAVSAGVHLAVLAGVVVLPLLPAQPLPESDGRVRAFFTEPLSLAPPPPPPPPPAPASARLRPRATSTFSPSVPAVAALVAVDLLPEEGLDLGGDAGALGGVEGGVAGGVVGGVLGELPVAPPPPPPLPQRVTAGRDISPPRKLRDVPPDYPLKARLARLQGVVIIECVIGKDGRVQSARVTKGMPMLDEAALEAVQQWTYVPSLLNGRPVEVLLTVNVAFALR